MTEGSITRELSTPRIPFPWEQSLLEELSAVIPTNDVIHGLPHILSVVKNVYELRFEPEFVNQPVDEEILVAGAYLHDIGYFFNGPFSKDTFEHVAYGVQMARDILTKNDSFDHQKIEKILYLIQNHDNAKFSVPNFHLGNTSRFSPNQMKLQEQTDDQGLRSALAILKEADSKEYTDLSGTERTFKYGQERGFPLHPTGESPSPHHPLNLCTLSNLLLFPHLAWLNATTAKGKLAAARGYIAAEDWVRRYCTEHNILYTLDQDMEEIQWAKSTHPELIPSDSPLWN